MTKRTISKRKCIEGIKLHADNVDSFLTVSYHFAGLYRLAHNYGHGLEYPFYQYICYPALGDYLEERKSFLPQLLETVSDIKDSRCFGYRKDALGNLHDITAKDVKELAFDLLDSLEGQMTKEELIDVLLDPTLLRSDIPYKADKHLENFLWIKNRVCKFEGSKDTQVGLVVELEKPFKKFVKWDTVESELETAIKEKDAFRLRLLSSDVEYDSLYYCFDDQGFLTNIGFTELYNLVFTLLRILGVKDVYSKINNGEQDFMKEEES